MQLLSNLLQLEVSSSSLAPLFSSSLLGRMMAMASAAMEEATKMKDVVVENVSERVKEREERDCRLSSESLIESRKSMKNL